MSDQRHGDDGRPPRHDDDNHDHDHHREDRKFGDEAEETLPDLEENTLPDLGGVPDGE